MPEPKAAPNPSLRGRCIRMTSVRRRQTITRVARSNGIRIDNIRAAIWAMNGKSQIQRRFHQEDFTTENTENTEEEKPQISQIQRSLSFDRELFEPLTYI
jgi:hypothetical protein